MKAKGFTVYYSKQGAEGVKDLLASGGEMVLGSPKSCVKVKTQDTPVDRRMLEQLGGVINNVMCKPNMVYLYNGMDLKTVSQEKNVISSSRFVCGILRMLLKNYLIITRN